MSDLNQQQPADRSVKITHLVFGLLFLGVAVVWALVVGDVIHEDDLAVLAPAILIAAGVVGLAASLASARNRRNRDNQLYDHPAEPELDDHTEEIR
jgi:cytochrome bd-type quinol oxidase subunit 2